MTDDLEQDCGIGILLSDIGGELVEDMVDYRRHDYQYNDIDGDNYRYMDNFNKFHIDIHSYLFKHFLYLLASCIAINDFPKVFLED